MPTALIEENTKIAIIGLGYVGLPLAIEFAKKFEVFGFDLNYERIRNLKCGYDETHEVDTDDLAQANNLSFTNALEDLKQCNIYIVAVPTPVDNANKPDMQFLIAASELVKKVLSVGDIVIYESTVYPGATEEVCVPILMKSDLEYNKDFWVGYSPERINPGDKSRGLKDIVKIVSGSSEYACEIVNQLYLSIITAGTFPASSIQVAEAAKVIENIQRDVNIALINEFDMLFSKLNLPTHEILDAANSKWNFLDFKPGLVGGHCIGVDPYYLTYRAEKAGFDPQLILAGRKINNSIPNWLASNLIKVMLKNGIKILNSRILIMGVTFKENCPDIRNSKVFNLMSELIEYGVFIDFYDPLLESCEVIVPEGVTRVTNVSRNYEAVFIAVGHEKFLEFKEQDFSMMCSTKDLIFDYKGIFPSDYGLSRVWS